MAGRRQKRPEDLQGKGSRYAGGRTLQLVPADASKPVPRAPKGLSPALRSHWRAYWGDAIAGRLTPADEYDVRQYFACLAERDELEAKANKEPIVTGDRGQQTLNPLYRRVNALNEAIRWYSEHLGILPLSRARLGWETARAAAGLSAVEEMRRRLMEREADHPDVIDLEDLE